MSTRSETMQILCGGIKEENWERLRGRVYTLHNYEECRRDPLNLPLEPSDPLNLLKFKILKYFIVSFCNLKSEI